MVTGSDTCVARRLDSTLIGPGIEILTPEVVEILVDVADDYEELEEMVRFSTYFNGRTRWLQLFECIGSAPSLAFTPQRHGLGIEVSSPSKDGLRL